MANCTVFLHVVVVLVKKSGSVNVVRELHVVCTQMRGKYIYSEKEELNGLSKKKGFKLDLIVTEDVQHR